MRYLKTVPLFLIVLILSAPVIAGQTGPGYSSDFEEFAAGQSIGLDSEWDKVVGKVTGGKARALSPVFTTRESYSSGMRRSGHRARNRVRSGNHYSAQWSGTVDSGGFIRHGISGQFLQNVTRDRSGPSRGTGMLRNPAQARLSGTRRKPFNASDFTRSGRVGARGSMRKSIRMGTRRSSTSSGTRNGNSSFGRLGGSRTRRRR